MKTVRIFLQVENPNSNEALVESLFDLSVPDELTVDEVLKQLEDAVRKVKVIAI